MIVWLFVYVCNFLSLSFYSLPADFNINIIQFLYCLVTLRLSQFVYNPVARQFLAMLLRNRVHKHRWCGSVVLKYFYKPALQEVLKSPTPKSQLKAFCTEIVKRLRIKCWDWVLFQSLNLCEWTFRRPSIPQCQRPLSRLPLPTLRTTAMHG